ncbi:FAD/NAD(P)-binding protein [Pseudotabrizicola sp. 4114]|uniref:FAD/NAD(P)-binding protein n=1 Tax=Pseudotabrizicola sp. 4114 TaxID=2817731 RepID=UPI00285AA96C|nr:putative NAD(P)/FAD-binding protein YdhS [Pseudorhodobacter sp. 4114]
MTDQSGGAVADSIPLPGPGRPVRHILVVGGGASGVLMATHLLSQPGQPLRVTLIEGNATLGQGIAYATTDPDHLLNTRVHNMSAFPDDPHHFHDWLLAHPDEAKVTEQCFVSRATYGTYLAGLLDPWRAPDGDGRLRVVTGTVVRVEETANGVLAHLEDGQALPGDRLVLATGHVQANPSPDGALSNPWEPQEGIPPDARVVIIGSGLSMVDQVLSLLRSGHRGEILSVSRRGQLPRSHAATTPLRPNPEDIPLGAPMSVLFRWVRGLARQAVQNGGTWRDAIDGIRPQVRTIWRALPGPERARFLRHAATWWEVHRHRMPNTSNVEIRLAVSLGQLVLLRAGFLGAARLDAETRRVTLRPRGSQDEITIDAARVIDCRGIRNDPESNAAPLFADLLQTGQARVDPLRLSLDVSADCQVINHAGVPSARIHAIGPVTRAAFWEITAIPDIREQAAKLARDLVCAGP